MKSKNFKQFVRGDDIDVKLTFTDETGNPLNLKSSTVKLTARHITDDEIAFILSNTDQSIDILENGVVILKFKHEHSKDLQLVDKKLILKYDVQILNVDNKRKTVLGGTIEFIEDQTRD